MSNIVIWFAESVLGEDRGRGLIDADQLLGKIHYVEHRVGVDNVIALAQEVDSLETIDRIEDIVRWTLYEQILRYGVKIDVTIPLDRQVLLLQSLYDIEDYNDPETMLQDLEDVGTPEERFCAVLVLLYGGTVEDYVEDLERVNADFLERIQQRMVQQKRNIEAQMPIALQTAAEQSTYPDFRAFYRHHQPERMQTLLNEGWQLGYPFDEYFTALADFDHDSQQQIALHYTVAALASGETFQQVRNHASDRLEPFYDSGQMQLLQKTLQHIRDLIEVVAYE